MLVILKQNWVNFTYFYYYICTDVSASEYNKSLVNLVLKREKGLSV